MRSKRTGQNRPGIKNWKQMSKMTGLTDSFIRDPGYRKALGLPDEVIETYSPLARGEYNINYSFAHPETMRKLILRVNTGSQMHLDRQIEYEAHALKLLSVSGRTPRVYYVDGSRRLSDHGILVMEFLPGRYPVYENEEDMNGVIKCLADIHCVSIPAEEIIYGEPFEVPRDTVRLIAPGSAIGAILDECEAMVRTYMETDIGSESVKSRLRKLLDRGHEIAAGISDDAGIRCCINTELNSTNFLVDDTGYVRLVDWEKPLYADPAQDLGHLLAPTTTFWKTDTVLSSEETDRLISEYIEAVRGRYDTDGIRRRTHEFITITCLRGLTWCAMAWVDYQKPGKLITNESTRIKLDQYLSDKFLSDIEKRFGL